jgi:hypothetical protein
MMQGFRVGYLFADPSVDLSRDEECRARLERVVQRLRRATQEVRFVAVQAGDVVLTDAGYGLQQLFEAQPDSNRPSASRSRAMSRFARETEIPESRLVASDLGFCAGRRLFRGCNLVQTRLSPFDVAGALCAQALAIPLVVDVVADPLSHPSERRDRESERWARASTSRTLGGADAVVTSSTALGESLVSEWGVPPDRLIVLPCEPAGTDDRDELTALYRRLLDRTSGID